MNPEGIQTETLHTLRCLYVDGFLTSQQYKTMRGQVLAGDIQGVQKGIRTILRRTNAKEIIRRAVIDEVPG